MKPAAAVLAGMIVSNHARQEPVVKKEQAQSDSQQIEERVIPGQQYEDLEKNGSDSRDLLQTPRAEHEKRQYQLNEKDRRGGYFLEPQGRLHHVPGDGRGQGLGFIMHGKRREIAPGRVATQQLDRARFKHEAEEKPAKQPHASVRGLEEDGQEAGFEEQIIPLVAHEDLTAGHDREVAHEQDDEGGLLNRMNAGGRWRRHTPARLRPRRWIRARIRCWPTRKASAPARSGKLRIAVWLRQGIP